MAGFTLTQQGGGAVAAPRRPAPERTGLGVAITAAADSRDRVAVDVQASGGQAPLRLYLYIDGELVGAWVQSAATWELGGDEVAPGRHVATARVIDASGRWGGASTVLSIPS